MTNSQFDFTDIAVQQKDKYAVIVLAREKSLNSLDSNLHRELLKALRDLPKPPYRARAILITGRGRAFSAGQDLEEVGTSRNRVPVSVGDLVRNNYVPLMTTLKSLDVPTVCAVNGIAAGAGASIALACDIVIACRDARFVQAFSKVGLMPDAGGTWMLPRLIGRSRALSQFFLNDAIDAQTAFELGMIARVVENQDLDDEANRVASILANGPTKAYVATRRAVDHGFHISFEESLMLETELQRDLGNTYDYEEGVEAFIQKRDPKFKGE